jgi:hypothetical protein
MKQMKTLKTKEGKKMRKVLITLFLVSLSVVLVHGTAYAVSGTCDQCHTMHNSQGGSPMAQDFSGAPLATAQPNLTVSTCLGCHNGQAAGAPVIFGDTFGTNTTAGGSFHDNNFTADANGHNVTDLVGILGVGLETDNTNATPGNGGDSTITVGLQALTCAGELGCHGNHDVAGDTTVTGFHHGAYSGAYRFLRHWDGGSHTDIKGKGPADCELGGADDAGHNVYYAMADDSAVTNDSISAFCSMCHGEFHDDVDTMSGSAWVRHPTEVTLPGTWTPTMDYDRNPFAFSGVDYTNAATNASYAAIPNPRVACISCHRAHATDQPDLLRFNYSVDMDAGGGNDWGCLGCHDAQR